MTILNGSDTLKIDGTKTVFIVAFIRADFASQNAKIKAIPNCKSCITKTPMNVVLIMCGKCPASTPLR